ncbi:hypothetical protein HELRODRAFT_172544 [Helobdella robusta]|uniref:Uncharacterized protein n=1 Tax=Helobdella robusta TaxID=6412 RepID=T1F5H6_HELRO|nr:hypothetical protein HELRODRAFT_172544 [Helobdella robusta]ESO04196.1 hypothetical protein HELRODRAFT_172544 [Helobdella robusta]
MFTTSTSPHQLHHINFTTSTSPHQLHHINFTTSTSPHQLHHIKSTLLLPPFDLIDQKLLDRTKSGLDQKMLEKIQTAFGIKWPDVTLQDMNKPLHNGLAARILIHLNGERIPAQSGTQIKIWRKVFHGGTDAADFNFFPAS